MRMNEITYTNTLPIDGYGPGFFRIGGQVHEGSLLTGPTGTLAWGGYPDCRTLLALSGEVDFIFIGTGKNLIHIPADLRSTLEGAGLGVEIMNSPGCLSHLQCPALRRSPRHAGLDPGLRFRASYDQNTPGSVGCWPFTPTISRTVLKHSAGFPTFCRCV